MTGEKSWILTDAEQDIWLETFKLTPLDLGMEGNWSIEKRVLRGGPGDGVDVIEVHNGALSFSILPTRGMGIWKGQYNGLDIGWNSPVRGPVHPNLVDLQDRGGLGWLAGFDFQVGQNSFTVTPRRLRFCFWGILTSWRTLWLSSTNKTFLRTRHKRRLRTSL